MAESNRVTTATIKIPGYTAGIENDKMGAPHSTIEPVLPVPLWRDIDALRPYAEAILELKRAGLFKTGFNSWPQPNPYYDRTPWGMYIQESDDGPDMRCFEELFTPFGQFTLQGSGVLREMCDASASFLRDFYADWELEDVTEHIQVYEVTQSKKKEALFGSVKVSGPYPAPRESWDGAGNRVRVYAVKRVKHHILVENMGVGSNRTPVVYGYTHMINEEYDRDRDIWRHFSGSVPD